MNGSCFKAKKKEFDKAKQEFVTFSGNMSKRFTLRMLKNGKRKSFINRKKPSVSRNYIKLQKSIKGILISSMSLALLSNILGSESHETVYT